MMTSTQLGYVLTRNSATPRKSSLTGTNSPQLDRQAKRVAKQVKQLDKQMVSDLYGSSPLVGAKSRSINLRTLTPLKPLTDTQQDFFDAYEDGGDSFVLYGSAGVGKSFLAIYHALQDILQVDSPYEKIIIVRSCVPGRELGHLPGTIEEKAEVYELPYVAIFADLLGRPDAYEKLKDMGKVEFMTTSFLRSLTFNNCIIVADEIQNETFSTISTLMTRRGKNSKMIVMGDGLQNDLTRSKHDVSGFRDFMAVATNMKEFQCFKFTSDDIVRSGFCKAWIMMTERLGL